MTKSWGSLPRRDDICFTEKSILQLRELQKEKVIDKVEHATCSKRVEHKCNDRGKQENFRRGGDNRDGQRILEQGDT